MIWERCRCGHTQPLLAATTLTSRHYARAFTLESGYATWAPRLRPPRSITATEKLRSRFMRNMTLHSSAGHMNGVRPGVETPAIKEPPKSEYPAAKPPADLLESNSKTPYLEAKEPPAQVIDTEAGIADLVDSLIITDLTEPFVTPSCNPVLYVNLLGIGHFRTYSKGAILLIHATPGNKTYLIDIIGLKRAALHTPGKNGKTLNDILQSKDSIKYFFMARSTCDVLFSQFRTKIYGARDLQHLNSAMQVKEGIKPFLPSFKSCVDSLSMSPQERIAWETLKVEREEIDKNLKTYVERPIAPGLTTYHAQIARYYPALRRHYEDKLSKEDLQNIHSATDRELEQRYRKKELAVDPTRGKRYGTINKDVAFRKLESAVGIVRKIRAVEEPGGIVFKRVNLPKNDESKPL